MVVVGTEFAKKILEALGLEHDDVTKIVITVEVEECVKFEVTRFLSNEQGDKVIKSLTAYRLEKPQDAKGEINEI